MRRWMWWLSPLVVMAVVGGPWLAGADYPVVGTRAPVAGLTGIDWQLAAFEENGQRWEVPGTMEGRVRFEGRSLIGRLDAFGAGATHLRAATVGARVCNSQGGDVVIHADSIEVGSVSSTLAGCDGDRGRAEYLLSRVLRANPAWSSRGDALRLSGDGVTAELRRRPAFPTTFDWRSAGSAAADPVPWQIGTDREADESSTLVWERARPDGTWETHRFPTGSPDPWSKVPADPEGHVVGTGEDPFVLAFIDSTSAWDRTARYESAGASTALSAMVSGQRTIFYGPVPDATGTIVVSGPDGTDVARIEPSQP